MSYPVDWTGLESGRELDAVVNERLWDGATPAIQRYSSAGGMWHVIGRMGFFGYLVEMRNRPDHVWVVTFRRLRDMQGESWSSESLKLSLAVCRAALLTLDSRDCVGEVTA